MRARRDKFRTAFCDHNFAGGEALHHATSDRSVPQAGSPACDGTTGASCPAASSPLPCRTRYAGTMDLRSVRRQIPSINDQPFQGCAFVRNAFRIVATGTARESSPSILRRRFYGSYFEMSRAGLRKRTPAREKQQGAILGYSFRRGVNSGFILLPECVVQQSARFGYRLPSWSRFAHTHSRR